MIKHWLDKHPMEVVTLLLTNGDSLNVSDFTHPFHASGIAHYAYTPLPSHNSGILDSWPTLGALVANGNRLVAFLDYGADTDEMAYLLPEFEYFWETPFDTTDPTFSQCKIDRPGGVKRRPELAGELMYIVNHYLDTEVLGMYVPNRRDARRTNAAKGVGSIEAQVELCAQVHGGKKPTAVLVDYFDKGEGLAVVERLNG